jgi:hypothetical protein
VAPSVLSAVLAVSLLEVLEATKRDPSTDLQAFSDLPRCAPCGMTPQCYHPVPLYDPGPVPTIQ